MYNGNMICGLPGAQERNSQAGDQWSETEKRVWYIVSALVD